MGADTPDARWSNLPEPALYARDGRVVQGTASESSGTDVPRHEVGSPDGSRMYLLELYQKTVQEKEALTRETQSLHEAVVRAGETQRAIEKERDDAREQSARLTKELERASADNVDLAARLVTAQIRRLEAERLVLEARIVQLRREATDTAGAVLETSAPKPTGNKEKPAATPANAGGHP